jgi:hypothetical protein
MMVVSVSKRSVIALGDTVANALAILGAESLSPGGRSML